MTTGLNPNRKRLLPLFSLLLVLLFSGCLEEEPAPAPFERQIYELPWSQGTPEFLDGYARTIAGTEFSYHAAHPQANASLLLRSESRDNFIAWETVPVAADYAEPFVTFAVLMSLDVNAADPHRFDWYMNDNLVFSFSSPSDTASGRLDMEGKDGAHFRFEPMLVDRHGDISGVAYIKFPVGTMERGRAVKMKVVGETADSPTWLIVFKHLLRPKITLTSEQALIRQGENNQQLIRTEIFHMGDPSPVAVTVDDNEPWHSQVKKGWNTLLVPVPAVQAPQWASVEVATADATVGWSSFAMMPVTQREIWMIPHSHVDIGYTDVPSVVEKKHWKNFRDAIAQQKTTASYPEDVQFKWNVESLWAVKSYLERSGDNPAPFLEAVKNGTIGLDALYGNALTGISGEDELFELVRYANDLREQHGITVESAMLTDVPGSTWGLIPVLAQSGVKYFTSGPNYDPSLPHLGDRIGYTLESWGDKPFYWVSQSEQEEVLFLMAGRGYSWFHNGRGGAFREERAADVFAYMNALDLEGYPYDMVQVRCGVGGDNGPIDADLSAYAKAWNEKYVSPKIVISTNTAMCKEFEKRHRDKIPHLKGDMTEYWADGAASTAKELSDVRHAREQLVQAATAHAMFGQTLPADLYSKAWEHIVLFDEHTWGADNSISNPDLPSVAEQWNAKRVHATEAVRLADELLSVPTEAAEGKATIYNTASWGRGGLITMQGSIAAGANAARIGGKTVPVQQLKNGEIAFVSPTIPAYGAVSADFVTAKADAADFATSSGRFLQNEFLTVTIDEATGAIQSVLWKAKDLQLVDSTKLAGLNLFQYVIGAGTDTAKGLTNVHIEQGEAGPVVASLIVTATAPGCGKFETEYRLISGQPYVEIINRIEKTAVREKESIHLGFPFLVPTGGIAFDMPWSTVLPNTYQLKGANKNVFPVQRWADVFNSDFGVTLVSPDAPLFEVGGMTADEWQHKRERPWLKELQPSQTLYSYALNNSWHTNFKADQEGPLTFRYYVRPHERLSVSEADRFGRDICRPLRAVAGSATLGNQLFTLPDSTAVIATSVVPQPDGDLLIRLFNTGTTTQKVALSWPGGTPASVQRCNPFGQDGKPVSEPLELAAQGIVTLRVRR